MKNLRRLPVVRALAAWLAVVLLSWSASAAQGVARIPVKVVNGRLVVACQISAQKRIAANLFIDYESPFGLLLHNRAADGIEAEAEDGTPRTITVHLPDLNLTVAQRGQGDQDYYENFTKWWSKELGENAVVGTLGAEVLAGYHATFDLAAGFLELSAPHAADPVLPEPVGGATIAPLSVKAGTVWFQVAFGERRGAAMALATSKPDTWIDADLADELGAPAGDIGSLRLGELDLARFVALRPERVTHTHPDGVFGLTGLDLLQCFRVEVDRVNGWMRWTQSAPPRDIAPAQAYYKLRHAGDASGLEQWLTANPSERLAAEAAGLLLDLRLEQNADAETMRRAFDFVQGTRPADLKSTGALELVAKMRAAGKPADALAAGELGLASGREDRYPEAVHKLHAALGAILLEQGDRRAAWRHLLSAAFGLPEDGPLNLDLGRCYEADERWGRAFSRYLQALLSPESGADAIAGLERVQPRLGEDESFSVELVERLIEGRVDAFGAATRFRPEEGEPTTRVVLAEYFTSTHFPFEIGVTLARDGLRDHFGRDYLVQLTYSVPDPELDPLVNPLSMYMWEAYGRRQIAHIVDGVAGLPAGARARFKQEVYDACRGVIAQRLGDPTEHAIEIEAHADRERIRGSVLFRGPDDDLTAHVMLVERGVLFPGKSKVVIHRNVVRSALTEELEGTDYLPQLEEMTLDFERSWAEIHDENARFLDEREAAGDGRVPRFAVRIDPRQASVVAVLRRRGTGEVVQCTLVDAVLSEDLK